jgi:hypothetical protein
MDALSNDFVKQWTLNTFYGWLIGFAFILVLAIGLEAIGLTGQFFIGTGMGAGVGWMQWRLGRHAFDLDKRWIWASIIGMTLPFLVLDYGPGLPISESFRLPAGVLDGAVLTGILQAYLIRKRSPKAWWWFFICMIAWTTAPILILVSEQASVLFGKTYVTGFLTLLLILAGGLSIGWVGAIGLKKIL